MRIGAHGQVTIPKHIRDEFGLKPKTEVEFRVIDGNIVLRRTPNKLTLAKWKGYCGKTFAQLGYSAVDEFMNELRGR